MREINFDQNTRAGKKPVIHKHGIVSVNGEMTPFIFKNRLYRIETMNSANPSDPRSKGGFIIRDVETNDSSEVTGQGWHYFSCYCENDTVYAYGMEPAGDAIGVFVSSDLKNWSYKKALKRKGWTIYNNSVCKGRDHYIMSYEVGAPEDKVGVPFTIFFAWSDDLINWTFMNDDICFGKDRYVACPCLRYLPEDDCYYMIAHEALPHYRFAPYIYRTRDFETWEVGKHNPVLWISEEDRMPKPGMSFDSALVEKMQTYLNINNCDTDMCEWQGKTYINYLTGNQLGEFYFCEAHCDSTLSEFLRQHFN